MIDLSKLSDFFSKNQDMLTYLLASEGQNLSKGGNFGAGVGQAVMNTLASKAMEQKQNEYLAKLLSGVGEGGEVHYNDKGGIAKIKVGKRSNNLADQDVNLMAGSLLGDTTNNKLKLDTVGEPTRPFVPSRQTTLTQSQTPSLPEENPYSSFVGMTPQNISAAYQNALEAAKLKASMVPKKDPVIATLPGYGPITMSIWKELPNDTKQYAMYYTSEILKGNKNVLDEHEFKMLDDNERYQLTLKAMKNSKFKDMFKELFGPGGFEVNIGGKSKLSELAGKKYFDDPHWIDDVKSYLESPEAAFDIYDASDEDFERVKKAIQYVEQKIRAGRGRLLKEKGKEPVVVDTKEGVIKWKVTWPEGVGKSTVVYRLTPKELEAIKRWTGNKNSEVK